VDGDEELMRMNPKTHDAVWGEIINYFENYVKKDIEAPRETYAPYITDLVNKAEKLRKENPDKTVAVAFALYRKSSRDFIREISKEPVSFVQIDVTEAEFIARNMPRVNDFCKEAGKTLEEAYNMWGCDKIYGAYTGPESWEKMFLADDYATGFQTIEQGEPDSYVIDSGISSVGTVPGLEKCLGLKHIENPDIKAVC